MKDSTTHSIPICRPYLGEQEAQAAADAVLSGWVTQGPRVEEFEERFAGYTGAQYAVAVSSCTTALHCALIAAGVGPGDEVVCPSMSFIATANAVRYAGARPVFSEINPSTYNIDPLYAAECISPRTKAILIVHQMGMPADIDAFRRLCEERNLALIEDAACAAGSVYRGGKIGSHSPLVCFSFHPRKVITTGDGGMITTDNKKYAQRLKRMRQHGMSVSDRVRHLSGTIITEQYDELGYNYRMTDIQASVGIVQLGKLDTIVSRYRTIASRYAQQLGGIKHIRLPIEPEGCVSNFQSYSIYLTRDCPVSRDDLMQKLLDRGIATRRGIMTIHREKAYTSEYGTRSLPVTEDTCDRSLLLPIFYALTEDDISRITASIRDILGV